MSRLNLNLDYPRHMCPHCQNNRMVEPVTIKIYFCNCCSRMFKVEETNDTTRESEDRSKDTSEAISTSDEDGRYPRCVSDN